MTTYILRGVTCGRKCAGGNTCTCDSGHKAPHICDDEHCRCHAFGNYGLVYNERRDCYQRDNTHGATEVVRVLEVKP